MSETYQVYVPVRNNRLENMESEVMPLVHEALALEGRPYSEPRLAETQPQEVKGEDGTIVWSKADNKDFTLLVFETELD